MNRSLLANQRLTQYKYLENTWHFGL